MEVESENQSFQPQPLLGMPLGYGNDCLPFSLHSRQYAKSTSSRQTSGIKLFQLMANWSTFSLAHPSLCQVPLAILEPGSFR